MANAHHLSILKQGIIAWRQWRAEHADVYPDLSAADLRGLRLVRADLSRTNLSLANLSSGQLMQMDLSGAQLEAANLAQSRLTGSDLSCAMLTRANLQRADLMGAYLSGADLHEVDLRGALLGWTTLGDVDLSTVRGLETVRHSGPSTIGIDTLYRSQGDIPEVFLQRAGVPDKFMTFLRSSVRYRLNYHTWATDIRRTRYIGDFRKWKEHDAYHMAFARLVRDLTAGGERASDAK